MGSGNRSGYYSRMTVPAQFLPDPLPADPMPLAAQWLTIARSRRDQPNPNAMVVATVGADGRPSARVVLCKDLVTDPGYVTFFTNYESHKGRDLAADARVAIVMHWDHLHRQLRIEGRARRTLAAESDAYFNSRPWQRRIGAWASEQSRPVDSRAALEAALVETAKRFGTPVPGPEDAPDEGNIGDRVPRPPHWGGFDVYVESIELWVEGESRIHDRARWTRDIEFDATPGAPVHCGPWRCSRLQP